MVKDCSRISQIDSKRRHITASLAGENIMIDDIAEGMGKAIFKGISRSIFEILIEFLFFYTGEIVLFIVTLGKNNLVGIITQMNHPQNGLYLLNSVPGSALHFGFLLPGLLIVFFSPKDDFEKRKVSQHSIQQTRIRAG